MKRNTSEPTKWQSGYGKEYVHYHLLSYIVVKRHFHPLCFLVGFPSNSHGSEDRQVRQAGQVVSLFYSQIKHPMCHYMLHLIKKKVVLMFSS